MHPQINSTCFFFAQNFLPAAEKLITLSQFSRASTTLNTL